MPFTGSAGYVAQRPKTATRLPPKVAMFQIAGSRRSSVVIGSFWPVVGWKRVKSRMPCSSGLRPVIIVVQTRGESGGCRVWSAPPVPFWTSAARFGIAPAAR